MNKIKTALWLSVGLNITMAQSYQFNFQDSLRTDKIRIGFYNCENFYDYIDDTLTNDEAFLPQGDYHWTKSKFYTKASALGRVILNMGGWEPPEIVGLCEVENDFALHTLTHASGLKAYAYRYVHYDSDRTCYFKHGWLGTA